MMAYSETFRQMTRLVRQVADQCCEGRLLAIHEGGYSEAYAPFCGPAVLEELSGELAPVLPPQSICRARYSA